ncbi:hypothetical protein H0V99_01950 [Candidatus Saccharibacteria bacterium]|nr:hypothetical protein [Candidatus Saccharibacteria bacterium]
MKTINPSPSNEHESNTTYEGALGYIQRRLVVVRTALNLADVSVINARRIETESMDKENMFRPNQAGQLAMRGKVQTQPQPESKSQTVLTEQPVEVDDTMDPIMIQANVDKLAAYSKETQDDIFKQAT